MTDIKEKVQLPTNPQATLCNQMWAWTDWQMDGKNVIHSYTCLFIIMNVFYESCLMLHTV